MLMYFIISWLSLTSSKNCFYLVHNCPINFSFFILPIYLSLFAAISSGHPLIRRCKTGLSCATWSGCRIKCSPCNWIWSCGVNSVRNGIKGAGRHNSVNAGLNPIRIVAWCGRWLKCLSICGFLLTNFDLIWFDLFFHYQGDHLQCWALISQRAQLYNMFITSYLK